MCLEEDQSPATFSDNYDQARSLALTYNLAVKKSRTQNNKSLNVDEITRAARPEVDRSNPIAQRRK